MDKFDIGETVICWRNVKNDAGEYVDPADSMKITITDKNNMVKADGVDMAGGVPESEGKYHYDCQTVGYIDGRYEVKYEAIDGTRITIAKETFTLG